MLVGMYSKNDVGGGGYHMSFAKKREIGILSIHDTNDGVNQDYLGRFSEYWSHREYLLFG